jgi:hypothetical protein
MEYGLSGLAPLAREALRFAVAYTVSGTRREPPAAAPLNITCPALHSVCECPAPPAAHCGCVCAAPRPLDGALVFAAGLAVGIVLGGLLETLVCRRRSGSTPVPAQSPAEESRRDDEAPLPEPHRPLPVQRVPERGSSPPGGATPAKAALRAIEDLVVWVPPARRSRA